MTTPSQAAVEAAQEILDALENPTPDMDEDFQGYLAEIIDRATDRAGWQGIAAKWIERADKCDLELARWRDHPETGCASDEEKIRYYQIAKTLRQCAGELTAAMAPPSAPSPTKV